MAKVTLYTNIPLTNRYADPIIFKYKTVEEFLTAKAGSSRVFDNVNVEVGSIIESDLTVIKPDATLDDGTLANANYAKVEYNSREFVHHGTGISLSYAYYYFVKSVVYESRNKIKITLELDVFTTYGKELSFTAPLFTKRKHCDRWEDTPTDIFCKTEEAMLPDAIDASFNASVVKNAPVSLKRDNAIFKSNHTNISAKLSELKWIYIFHNEVTSGEDRKYDSPVKSTLKYVNGVKQASSGETPSTLYTPLRCVVVPSKTINVKCRELEYIREQPITEVKWSPNIIPLIMEEYGPYIVSVIVSDYPPFTATNEGRFSSAFYVTSGGALQMGSASRPIPFRNFDSENGKTVASATDGEYVEGDMLGISLSALKTGVDGATNIHYFERVDNQYYVMGVLNLFNPKCQAPCDPGFVNDDHWSITINNLVQRLVSTPLVGDEKFIGYEPKLNCYPYRKRELRCYGSNGIEVHPMLDTENGNFKMGFSAVITAEGCVLSLMKETGYDKYSSIYGGKAFPKNIYLPVDKDQYKDYMAYNGNQFQSQFVMGNIQHAIQAFSTTPAKHFSGMNLGSVTSQKGGSTSASGLGIAQQAVALGADQLQDTFDWANSIVGYQSKVKDLKDAPDKYTGVSQSPYLTELQGTPYDWYLVQYDLIESERQIVFDYFYNNGYEVDRMCHWGIDDETKEGNKDNILNRKLFNYVQIMDESLVSKIRNDIPLIAKMKINSVLSRGCKIWLFQSCDDFDYYLTETQENPERYF